MTTKTNVIVSFCPNGILTKTNKKINEFDVIGTNVRTFEKKYLRNNIRTRRLIIIIIIIIISLVNTITKIQHYDTFLMGFIVC